MLRVIPASPNEPKDQGRNDMTNMGKPQRWRGTHPSMNDKRNAAGNRLNHPKQKAKMLPDSNSNRPVKKEATKKVLKYDTEEDVAVALAKYTADLSEKYIKEKGSFSVVLSGGTLIDTLRKLVEHPYKSSVDWSKWLIFWVDERVVPLDDKDSNYLLAVQGFLSKVPIPSSNIYAINDQKSPEGAADDYEERLKRLRHEKKRWVTFITDSPKPPPPRITFTFPVINSASDIAMVITGAELADTVKLVLGTANCDLPAGAVCAEGELTWFLDKDAASKL
ncbi:hypothetical protein BUALT_Bualt06G0085900 [Buddleja alternifolia]|uniref:Glucosamine/galactosamine-6-phosphate isomerase domain-containing protein n=1 Tax=Buddleja alternifolia TaxID=168488 RepID=A0AAV6XF96_9LAMI|nr:hypothetical protein BUALT_Bualt06G0085900 [Buddleja alternifolia]